MAAIQSFHDFRTGMPTGINGVESTEAVRQACHQLNRERMPEILALSKLAHSSTSPLLVDLGTLGLTWNDQGTLSSKSLLLLEGGKESTPYRDGDMGVVYKLFEIQPDGVCGKKLKLRFEESEERFFVEFVPARLAECLGKIYLLNCMGAHPTEIVGLTTCRKFFISKQPLAQRIGPKRQKIAQRNIDRCIARVRGSRYGFSRFDKTCAVVWSEGTPWLLSDFHHENIMKDASGRVTLIDGLFCSLSKGSWPIWLQDQIADARALANGEAARPVATIDKDVKDDEL